MNINMPPSIPYLLFFLLPILCNAACYYPNGNPATSDVQCTPGPNSACCGNGSICLSNGLCLSVTQPFGLSRGSCTDPNFGIEECPDVCTDVQPYGGSAIVLYNATENGIYYCCNSIVNNGTEPQPRCAYNEPFTLESAVIVPGVALLEDYEQSNDTSTGTNRTIDANSKASGSGTDSDSGSECSSATDHDVAIGVGVGVPLGLIALAGIAWALYERKNRHKHPRSLDSHLHPNSHHRAVPTISTDTATLASNAHSGYFDPNKHLSPNSAVSGYENGPRTTTPTPGPGPVPVELGVYPRQR